MIQSATFGNTPLTLDWGNAVSQLTAYLTQVDPTLPLSAATYAQRDRELAFRDVITASALMSVSMQAATIWNYDSVKLTIPVVPTSPDSALVSNKTFLYATPSDRGLNPNSPGEVDHVSANSVPYDAVGVDQDLYNRDILIFEAVARVAQSLFPNSPVASIDPNLIIDETWSQAQGAGAVSGLEPAQGRGYGVHLFQDNDRYLAFRDNVVANFAAALINQLNSVYETANRLLIQVNGSDAREPEVYSLLSDDGVRRIWAAGPLLSNRLRLIYDRTLKTVQWVTESGLLIHTPQPAALTFAGFYFAENPQTLTVIADLPVPEDVEFLRQKAARINLSTTTDVPYFDPSVAPSTLLDQSTLSASVLTQPDGSAILTSFPNSLNFNFPGLVLPAGEIKVSCLFSPSASVALNGNQFQHTGYGAVDPVSGGGYLTSPVSGNLSGSGTLQYQLQLQPGVWELALEFTDSNTAVAAFPLTITYAGTVVFSGNMPFGEPRGAITQSPVIVINVTEPVSVNQGVLQIIWTSRLIQSGSEVLYVKSVTARQVLAQRVGFDVQASMSVSADLPVVNVAGYPDRPDVLEFTFNVDDTNDPDPTLSLNVSQPTAQGCNFAIEAIEIKQTVPAVVVSDAAQLSGYRWDLLDRAVKILSTAWDAYVQTPSNTLFEVRSIGPVTPGYTGTLSLVYGSQKVDGIATNFANTDLGKALITNGQVYQIIEVTDANHITIFPQYAGNTSQSQAFKVCDFIWDKYANRRFIDAMTQGGATRIEDVGTSTGAFRPARPSDVGRPALVPEGLGYVDGPNGPEVRAYFTPTLAGPVIRALQPWMISAGIYVAKEDFWLDPSQCCCNPTPTGITGSGPTNAYLYDTSDVVDRLINPFFGNDNPDNASNVQIALSLYYVNPADVSNGLVTYYTLAQTFVQGVDWNVGDQIDWTLLANAYDTGVNLNAAASFFWIATMTVSGDQVVQSGAIGTTLVPVSSHNTTAVYSPARVAGIGTVGCEVTLLTVNHVQQSSVTTYLQYVNGIGYNINGIFAELPRTSDIPSGGKYPCPLSGTVTEALGGLASREYTLMLRVRGAVETKQYSGGTLALGNSTGVCLVNAAPVFDGYNIFGITVNGDTYYLNNKTTSFPTGTTHSLDYYLTIPNVPGQSEVTLFATSLGYEYSNSASAPDDDNALHPINVSQPYDGQFVQIDAYLSDVNPL